MNINKAIELLQQNRYDNPDYYLLDFQDAIDLAIEALKRCQDYKQSHIGLHYTPMPGETET